MSQKRNHHIIPKFYLKGFRSNPLEDNPKIWVYEKNQSKSFFDGKNEKLQNPKHLTTEKVARRRDFYAFQEKDGSKNYQKYEDILEQDFEKPNNTVLDKIRSFQIIEDEDKEKFSRYITSMIMRGRSGQRIFFQSKMELREQNLEKLKKQNLSEAETKRKQEEFVTKQEKEAKGEREIKRKIEIAEKYADHICSLNWYFFLAPTPYKFIASDRPVLYNKLLDLETWLLFPISSDVCLLAMKTPYIKHRNWKDKGNGYWEIDDSNFENLREILVYSAVIELYFCKKVKWLVDFINNKLSKPELFDMTLSQILKP